MRCLTLLAWAALCVTGARAAVDPRPLVVVADFTYRGVSTGEGRACADALARELARTGRFRVERAPVPAPQVEPARSSGAAFLVGGELRPSRVVGPQSAALAVPGAAAHLWRSTGTLARQTTIVLEGRVSVVSLDRTFTVGDRGFAGWAVGSVPPSKRVLETVLDREHGALRAALELIDSRSI